MDLFVFNNLLGVKTYFFQFFATAFRRLILFSNNNRSEVLCVYHSSFKKCDCHEFHLKSLKNLRNKYVLYLFLRIFKSHIHAFKETIILQKLVKGRQLTGITK